MKKLLEKLLGKLLEKPLEKLARHIEKWNRESDEARAAEESPAKGEAPASSDSPAQSETPAASASPAPSLDRFPLGLASCWNGSNASKRHMNLLSPKMSDSRAGEYIAWMKAKGCTVAHLILANGGDGESAGYAAWNDSDRPKMLARLRAVREAGLAPVPWLITDDSSALLKELFGRPGALIPAMAEFFDDVPYVVLGLEMDEGGNSAQWSSVRAALRRVYSGPIGVHHTSGNAFPFASYGDIVLGQLKPGCSAAQVKAQIIAILQLGKRAVGFEYSRGPDRSLCIAALEAGAEGVGNWDGGDVPSSTASAQKKEAAGADERESSAATAHDDAVEFGLLNWSYGGFKGGSAKLSAKARIMGLSVKSDGMSYQWMSGGCENLGASSSTDASCLACLFCLVGGRWVGGKFDWISTSRKTRDFKNIESSYNGWPKNAIANATRYAFVIVSKDGKSRTNVISCGR